MNDFRLAPVSASLLSVYVLQIHPVIFTAPPNPYCLSACPATLLSSLPPGCPPPPLPLSPGSLSYLTAPPAASSNKKLISQLQLEACAKAKEAGKHPSYTPLVLSLVHHYNLDINHPVLANSFTIFHCSCLSGSLELVSSLSPIADQTPTA